MRKNMLMGIALLLMSSSEIELNAQQQLNLDFEKVSVEGEIRPYNWELDHFSEVETRLDSNMKMSGNYSFCFAGMKEDAVQSISLSVEPFEFYGSTIVVSGWVKTDSLIGTVGITYGYGVEQANYNFEIHADTSWGKEMSKDWMKLEASFQIPDSANFAHISLHHQGKGTSWFDAFELKINDRSVQEVEVAAPFNSEQESWLAERATVLSTVNPMPSNSSQFYKNDLATFLEMNKDSRIIALGESTHGTSEFFRLKHRMLSVAVQELGVRIFALEDNQLIVEGVNRYVKGGEGTARSCMYGMFSISQNHEVHDLIQWVRDYNDLHPGDMISFVGFDMQYLPVMVDSLNHFLDRRIPDLKSQIDSLLAPMVEHIWDSYDQPLEERRRWLNDAGLIYEMVEKRVDEQLKNATTKQDCVDLNWGRQYTKLIKQYARNLVEDRSVLYRDEAMAENISWILDQYPPGSKMLIWAHDYHVSLGEHKKPENNIYSGVSMGHHLRKKFGSEYKAYGLWTYQGTYRAQRSYFDFQQFDCPLTVSPKGSLDEVFHRITLEKKGKGLFIDLKDARSQKWLCQPTPMRFGNHVAFEYAYFTRYSIPYQFDGIFFWDRTTAANSYAAGG